MSIARATKRIRNTKGSSYLTHGGDNYDHKALNRARRSLDRAIIAEQLENNEIASELTKPKTTFRIVITTQYHENYGAHSWDGEGECPQYWKAKGGSEYQRPIGDANDVIALGNEGIQKHLNEMTKLVSHADDYSQEYVINWAVVPTTEKTCEEYELLEMLEWGYTSQEAYDRSITKLQHGI